MLLLAVALVVIHICPTVITGVTKLGFEFGQTSILISVEPFTFS